MRAPTKWQKEEGLAAEAWFCDTYREVIPHLNPFDLWDAKIRYYHHDEERWYTIQVKWTPDQPRQRLIRPADDYGWEDVYVLVVGTRATGFRMRGFAWRGELRWDEDLEFPGWAVPAEELHDWEELLAELREPPLLLFAEGV